MNNWRWAISSIFLFVIVQTALGFEKNEFVRDIEFAKSLAAQEKQDEAIKYWEKLRPKYGGAQGHYEYELGNFYSNARIYDKAEKAYLDGIALKGKYPRLYIGLAFVYLDQNRFTDAEKWARLATTEFPNWWLGYHTLGEIARKQNNFKNAAFWLKKALNTEPQAQTYWLLAINSYELKEWQVVVDSMQAAINLDRTMAADEHGMSVVAISLAELGRYKDAYAAVETLKNNNPKMKESDTQKILANIKLLEQQEQK